MPNYLSDQAICLRVHDFSETSQIATLLTRTHGLVPLIAKGAKRQTKKGSSGPISGPLDLLTAGEVVFFPAKAAAELGTLTAWELTDHRTGLRTTLPGLYAGMLAADLTLTLLHPHDPHPDLFDELDATLSLLATPQYPRTIVAYAKAALSAAGYQPHLAACVSCGAVVAPEQSVRFHPRAGGIVCAACVAKNAVPPSPHILTLPGILAIALDRLPTPLQIQAAPPDRPADPAALRTALQLLLTLADTITDRPLRSRTLVPTIFGV